MIDQVAVRRSLGFELLAIEDWLSLDRGEKKRLLLDDRVEFLADGEEIPVREALQLLQSVPV